MTIRDENQREPETLERLFREVFDLVDESVEAITDGEVDDELHRMFEAARLSDDDDPEQLLNQGHGGDRNLGELPKSMPAAPRKSYRKPTNTTADGALFIHSAPAALCPHIEWAVGGVLGLPRVHLDWTLQLMERSTHRSEYFWTGPSGTAARLASALKGWQRVRFEVTEEPTGSSEGARYSYTPTLGIFYAIIGIHGDILIPEDRIRHAMALSALGGGDLVNALHALLGRAWDEELEPYRPGDEALVLRLHRDQVSGAG